MANDQDSRPEEDDIDQAAYDKYIGAKVVMETADGPRRATVKR